MIWMRIGFMMTVGLLTLLFAMTLTTSVSDFSLTKWVMCWGLSLLPMVWTVPPFDRLSQRLLKLRST